MNSSTARFLSTVCLLSSLAPGLADARRSENVRILSDVVGCGGGVSRATNGSPSVEIVSVVGGIGGGVASGGTHAIKGGYAGTLFEVTALEVAAVPAVIDELTGKTRLSGIATYDDGTFASVEGADIVWIRHTYPLQPVAFSGVFPNQVAETMSYPVYHHTNGTVTGFYLDRTVPGTGIVQVRDTGPTDAFGAYAADGLDDGFQFAFFGPPPNPAAAPDADPDKDGRNNRIEELTGFDPTNPGQYFLFRILGVSNRTAHFEFNKVMPGRIYTVRRGAGLPAFPDTITSFSPMAVETGKRIQDTNAIGSSAFYQWQVSRP